MCTVKIIYHKGHQGEQDDDGDNAVSMRRMFISNETLIETMIRDGFGDEIDPDRFLTISCYVSLNGEPSLMIVLTIKYRHAHNNRNNKYRISFVSKND